MLHRGITGRATPPAIPSCRCGSMPPWSTRRWPSPTRGWNRCRRRGARPTTRRRDRSGGRSASPTPCCRPMSRRSTGMSRRCWRPTGRSGSLRSPVSSPRSSCGRHSRRWPRCCRSRRRRCGRFCERPGRRLCVDAMAIGRPVAGVGPRRLRPAVGCPRTHRVGLAGRRFRAWRPLLPASFRQMPKALAADRRMAGGPTASRRRSRRRRWPPFRPSGPALLAGPVHVRVGDDLVRGRCARRCLVDRRMRVADEKCVVAADERAVDRRADARIGVRADHEEPPDAEA